MDLILGLACDGCAYPDFLGEGDGALHAVVVGASGLIDVLEVQLGLTGPRGAEAVRIATYAAKLRPAASAGSAPFYGVGTQNGPRYTLRFCRAFDGAHLAKRSERGGWRIGIGPEVIAGEIDMLPTER